MGPKKLVNNGLSALQQIPHSSSIFVQNIIRRYYVITVKQLKRNYISITKWKCKYFCVIKRMLHSQEVNDTKSQMNLWLGLIFFRHFLKSVDNFMRHIHVRFWDYRIRCRYYYRHTFITTFSDCWFQWYLNHLDTNWLEHVDYNESWNVNSTELDSNQFFILFFLQCSTPTQTTNEEHTEASYKKRWNRLAYLTNKLQTHFVSCLPSSCFSKNERRFTTMWTLKPTHVLYKSQNL